MGRKPARRILSGRELIVIVACIHLTQVSAYASLAFCSGTVREKRADLTVLVFNAARVRRSDLCDMERETKRLLSNAGALVQFVSCSLPDKKVPLICWNKAEPTRLVLQILSSRPGKNAALGSAVPDGTRGVLAQVYWTGISSAMQGQRAETGLMLGFVATHEIGHLLLGNAVHSRVGIMSGTLLSDTIERIAIHGVVQFTADECKLISRNVAQRSQMRAHVLSQEIAAAKLTTEPAIAGSEE